MTIHASLLAALGTGLVGLFTFGTLHAWWIVPIWDRADSERGSLCSQPLTSP